MGELHRVRPCLQGHWLDELRAAVGKRERHVAQRALPSVGREVEAAGRVDRSLETGEASRLVSGHREAQVHEVLAEATACVDRRDGHVQASGLETVHHQLDARIDGVGEIEVEIQPAAARGHLAVAQVVERGVPGDPRARAWPHQAAFRDESAIEVPADYGEGADVRVPGEIGSRTVAAIEAHVRTRVGEADPAQVVGPVPMRDRAAACERAALQRSRERLQLQGPRAGQRETLALDRSARVHAAFEVRPDSCDVDLPGGDPRLPRLRTRPRQLPARIDASAQHGGTQSIEHQSLAVDRARGREVRFRETGGPGPCAQGEGIWQRAVDLEAALRAFDRGRSVQGPAQHRPLTLQGETGSVAIEGHGAADHGRETGGRQPRAERGDLDALLLPPPTALDAQGAIRERVGGERAVEADRIATCVQRDRPTQARKTSGWQPRSAVEVVQPQRTDESSIPGEVDSSTRERQAGRLTEREHEGEPFEPAAGRGREFV